MSDESLTNAAVEWIRDGYALLRDADGPPPGAEVQESVSSDFRYVGRNRVSVNFGEMTHSDWPAMVTSFWDMGVGRPQFSEPLAIAVRGQRCAAITASIHYGNDTFTDFIHCIRLDTNFNDYNESSRSTSTTATTRSPNSTGCTPRSPTDAKRLAYRRIVDMAG